MPLLDDPYLADWPWRVLVGNTKALLWLTIKAAIEEEEVLAGEADVHGFATAWM